MTGEGQTAADGLKLWEVNIRYQFKNVLSLRLEMGTVLLLNKCSECKQRWPVGTLLCHSPLLEHKKVEMAADKTAHSVHLIHQSNLNTSHRES